MKRFDHLFKVGALGAGILALSALGGGTQGCGGDGGTGGTGGTGGSGGGTGGDGGTGGGGGAKPSYCGFNADRLAICGDVKSAAGGALKGATVRLDGQVTTTAADGSFKIDASLGGTHVLWLEAAGFSPLTTVVTESSEGRSFTLAPIVEITVQNLGASIGITDPFSGATVTVDPADLIDEKGDPIAPPIMVGIHYINPALQPLPGDDGAIDVNSMPTYLKSYGALYVEARYPDGTKISLKPGAQAEVKIPIPKDRLDFAPGTLPLWVFDSTAGVWREQPGGGLQQTPNAVQPPCKEVPTCNGAGCSALSTSAFVGSSPSLGFVNADVAQTDKPACLRIEIDGAAVAAADLPVCIHLVGPVGSPVTQAHRGCFNAGVGVYYNLPPNVDVTIERLVDIGCLPAPGGTSVIVNTGASWGGQGYPPSASVCNGVLSIPPLP